MPTELHPAQVQHACEALIAPTFFVVNGTEDVIRLEGDASSLRQSETDLVPSGLWNQLLPRKHSIPLPYNNRELRRSTLA